MKINTQNGFTMLEVMFALVVFSILLAGMPNFFISQSQLVTRSEVRTEAIAAAKQRLDELRLVDPLDLPLSGIQGPDTVEINDRSFQLTTYFCEVPEFCATENNRHIGIEVEYKGEVRYEVDTVFTKLR